jgi:hypothetical protein
MKLSFTWRKFSLLVGVTSLVVLSGIIMSSSHREAPLISEDPQADNTDLYAFRSPADPNKIIIIANYIPAQLPQGGPNYYSFGENIRYEIHIDNNVQTTGEDKDHGHSSYGDWLSEGYGNWFGEKKYGGDDIIYRFTFNKTNEDPTTFFNIRLGKQNLKTTYTLERSIDGGKSFQIIVSNGPVPPPNVGPRSISSPVGLNAPDYESLINKAITTANTGERVFAGTADDPFFVDLGGIFDLGDAPRQSGQSVDGLKCLNVSTLALEIDIATLQKDHKPVARAVNILDGDYVIGVWASASRRKIRTLRGNGREDHFGPWVQVSRLGMPLTNEVVIPIGYKDYWNSLTPYEDLDNLKVFGNFFYNPELALYMDDAQFGSAVPAFSKLRIQKASLGRFGFGNGQNGLFDLKGTTAVSGTALDDAVFGNLLLPAPNSPRSVDLFPLFNTGVPNLRPYQLAVDKHGNPLAAGKPFINNFLPNGGDMLRLNMAVPPTPRNSPDFNAEGLIQAAVLGLTDPRFNTTKNLQNIPNMDGFPNGRRLEDDVTRIELQAVSGVVLAAIGLWYDDFTPGGSPVTPRLVNVLTYSTGVDANDTAFKASFPFEASPWAGTHICSCSINTAHTSTSINSMSMPNTGLGMSSPSVILTTSPNPSTGNNTIRYHLAEAAHIQITVYDVSGKPVRVLVDKNLEAGTYTLDWNMSGLAKGNYFIGANKNGVPAQSVKVIKQ